MKFQALLKVLCLSLVMAGCNRAPAGGEVKAGTGGIAQDNPRFMTDIPLVRSADNMPAEQQPAAPITPVEEQWGIRIISLRPASAGYMLDLRFKVLDPDKAKPLLDKRNVATLIHPRSGATLSVPTSPKVGALRQKTTEPVAGRTYFMFFRNPGQMVKPGEKVSIVIGDFRADHVAVQ